MQEAERKWLVALSLSVVLGWLGIDRFYLRHNLAWGILKLITAGGFGIWWIVDIILIVMGQLKYGGTSYLKPL